VTPSPTLTLTPTLTPTLTLTPTITYTPSVTPTRTPIASPTRTDPASDPNATPVPTWTPPPLDGAPVLADHYHLRRPIGDGSANWVARTYPYGSTAGRRLQTHLGVDMENPRGTPILAAGDGVVLYAGDDSAKLIGPKNTYYGNLVLIQHTIKTVDGQPVFTLYGHMQRVDVAAGQMVKTGDMLGMVGDSGVALGPHLHFEVRVGDAYNWRATRNPELWIYPYQGYGTLAGRVTDAAGTLLYDVTLQVTSTDISRYAFSYADDTVNPDSQFNENFVLGDLPANYYTVTVSEGGRVRFREMVYIFPNRTTWIDVRLN
jgi:murein DD-endopeptidase MepM/ murein hydrolase activator NlpD